MVAVAAQSHHHLFTPNKHLTRHTTAACCMTLLFFSIMWFKDSYETEEQVNILEG